MNEKGCPKTCKNRELQLFRPSGHTLSRSKLDSAVATPGRTRGGVEQSMTNHYAARASCHPFHCSSQIFCCGMWDTSRRIENTLIAVLRTCSWLSIFFIGSYIPGSERSWASLRKFLLYTSILAFFHVGTHFFSQKKIIHLMVTHESTYEYFWSMQICIAFKKWNVILTSHLQLRGSDSSWETVHTTFRCCPTRL